MLTAFFNISRSNLVSCNSFRSFFNSNSSAVTTLFFDKSPDLSSHSLRQRIVNQYFILYSSLISLALLPEIKSSAIMALNSLSKCLFIIQIYSFGLYKFVTSNVDTPLPFNTSWYWIFKRIKQTEISKSELIEIEKIIKTAIEENNKQQYKELKNHNNINPDIESFNSLI
jgi:hypothetical protein